MKITETITAYGEYSAYYYRSYWSTYHERHKFFLSTIIYEDDKLLGNKESVTTYQILHHNCVGFPKKLDGLNEYVKSKKKFVFISELERNDYIDQNFCNGFIEFEHYLDESDYDINEFAELRKSTGEIYDKPFWVTQLGKPITRIHSRQNMFSHLIGDKVCFIYSDGQTGDSRLILGLYPHEVELIFRGAFPKILKGNLILNFCEPGYFDAIHELQNDYDSISILRVEEFLGTGLIFEFSNGTLLGFWEFPFRLGQTGHWDGNINPPYHVLEDKNHKYSIYGSSLSPYYSPLSSNVTLSYVFSE